MKYAVSISLDGDKYFDKEEPDGAFRWTEDLFEAILFDTHDEAVALAMRVPGPKGRCKIVEVEG